jgi:predicted SAM-dependent methyltransferase
MPGLVENTTRRGRRVFGAIPRIASSNHLINSYLKKEGLKKLNIGCGHNSLEGWLNIDYFPEIPSVAHFDARKRFPLPSAAFDYVFCEHMIEHVVYQDGLRMLSEAYRVLKPKGRIRVSTPDLKFLVELYSADKTHVQSDYINWSAERFTPNGLKTDTFVINNFVRAWGHRFIYDKKTLRHSLETTGFTQIEQFSINQSNDPELNHLENAARMPDGFFQLESLTLEATKP